MLADQMMFCCCPDHENVLLLHVSMLHMRIECQGVGFLACTGIALVGIKCVLWVLTLQIGVAAYWQCQSRTEGLGRSQHAFLQS